MKLGAFGAAVTRAGRELLTELRRIAGCERTTRVEFLA